MKKILFLIFGVLFLQLFLIISYLYYQSHKPHPVPLPIIKLYEVTRIIDGDTLVIQAVASPKGTVRLIGIDTPEVGNCYASEAASLLSELVLHKEVKVESDVNTLDQYGRALMHVYFLSESGEWRSLNAELL